jgi:purine-binding chemotaxis protein CheW
MADESGRHVSLELATVETYHHGYARRDRADEYQSEVLAFGLGREEYALDIQRIREIIKVRPMTEVPRAPSFIPGIISVRGAIVPVVDLRQRLRLVADPASKSSRILLVAKEAETYGLLVDDVRQVVRMRDEDIEPPPPMIGGVEAEFLSGIGRPRDGRMLILLHLDAVLHFGANVQRGVRV